MLTDQQVAELRSHFPILRNKTYLYSCSQGALSDAVECGMREYARSWSTASDPWGEWMGVYEGLRADFAQFINASPDEVAIVNTASAGINAIANALSFGKRNKVVMGEYEFPTMGQIWLAQQARGASVEFVDGTDGTIATDSYARTIDERTSIVPVTQVSFVNGFRSDVAGIVRLARAQGALVFLDGYQDCGTRPIDVKALDVDFFVTGTLKYLLSAAGVAFLYVRRELVEKLQPTITSWFSQRDVFAFNTKRLDPAPAARRFETGTPPVPNLFMARPALQLLVNIGMENVAAQIAGLARAFQRGARELGIASKTPPDSCGPLVVLRAKDSAAIVERLAARDIMVSARHDGVRCAFHVYNTLDDIGVALDALKQNLNLMVRC